MFLKKFAFVLLITVLYQSVGGAEPIKCYKCNSANDANCITDLSKITPQPCLDNEKCVTSVDTNGVVTRGCKPDDCTADNCRICATDSCNNQSICQTCDSSTDANCAKSGAIKATFNKVCLAADTKCLINIKGDKQTERRCATDDDITTCTDPKKCTTCSGGNCNAGIFPKQRLRCYQCNSSSENNCKDKVGEVTPQPCQLYDENEQCYMYSLDGTAMLRGCVSDTTTDNKCSNPANDARCLACKSDNCNNYNYNRTQSLKCVKCVSSKEDEKCMWGQDSSSAMDCANQIVYNQKEQCYTQLKDGVVNRGCLYDRTAEMGACDSTNGCDACSDASGCNSKDKMDYTCIRCRSDLDSKCRDAVDATVHAKTCDKPVSFEKRGCYHGVWNGVVIRSCLVDADERTQATCNDPKNNQCITCLEKDCNKLKTSGARALTSYASFIAVLCTILWSLWY